MPLKVIFAGTPAFALPTLQALLDASHEVLAVYTQPDRPAGRGRHLTPSPVKTLAEQAGVPVYQPERLGPQEQQVLADLGADLMVVVAYGLLLPTTVLATFPMGCLNVHASLLPRWRGAAPIQYAILAGDKKTGITIMQMDAGLDTGAMLASAECSIEPTDTSATLQEKLSRIGGDLLVKTVEDLSLRRIQPVPQDEHFVTYAKKIKKRDARLDWSLSAMVLARQVRAYNPWPVAFCFFQGEPLRVWEAKPVEYAGNLKPGTLVHREADAFDVACGEGALRVLRLQLPGGKPMGIPDFLNAKGRFCVVGNTL